MQDEGSPPGELDDAIVYSDEEEDRRTGYEVDDDDDDDEDTDGGDEEDDEACDSESADFIAKDDGEEVEGGSPATHEDPDSDPANDDFVPAQSNDSDAEEEEEDEEEEEEDVDGTAAGDCGSDNSLSGDHDTDDDRAACSDTGSITSVDSRNIIPAGCRRRRQVTQRYYDRHFMQQMLHDVPKEELEILLQEEREEEEREREAPDASVTAHPRVDTKSAAPGRPALQLADLLPRRGSSASARGAPRAQDLLSFMTARGTKRKAPESVVSDERLG